MTTRLPDETGVNDGEVHLGSVSGRVDAAGPLMQRKRRQRNTAVGYSVDARVRSSSGQINLWSLTPLTPSMIYRLSKGGKKI